MTQYANFKETEKIEKDYGIGDDSSLTLYSFINFTDTKSNKDQSILFKNTKDNKYICKVIFTFNHEKAIIKNFYDEYKVLIDIKQWLLSKTEYIVKQTVKQGDDEVALIFLNAYLKAVSDIELNCMIELEDGTSIECFVFNEKMKQINSIMSKFTISKAVGIDLQDDFPRRK
jgi:hypothetical protein